MIGRITPTEATAPDRGTAHAVRHTHTGPETSAWAGKVTNATRAAAVIGFNAAMGLGAFVGKGR